MLSKRVQAVLDQKDQKGPLRRARSVWFSPQDLIDIAQILVEAFEYKEIRRRLERQGISLERLAELADKMNKEVSKL
jgi:hypothetical protein